MNLMATVDNAVKVTLKPAEIDAGNDFVDSDMGSISGNVTDDGGGSIPEVSITLTNDDDPEFSVVILTGPDGSYERFH